jgi:hypothetical protein
MAQEEQGEAAAAALFRDRHFHLLSIGRVAWWSRARSHADAQAAATAAATWMQECIAATQ